MDNHVDHSHFQKTNHSSAGSISILLHITFFRSQNQIMKTTHYFHQYDIHNKVCKTPFDLFPFLHNQVSINITSIYKEYKTRETEEPRSESCTRHY